MCIHNTAIDVELMKVTFGHGIQITFTVKVFWHSGPPPNLRGRNRGIAASPGLDELCSEHETV